jgi:hypothetical protein
VARVRLIPTSLRIGCVVVCVAAMHGVVFAQQQADAIASASSANEKTVLRGTVVNSVTHQPIGRAVVMSQDGRFAVMTNDRGQFEMKFKEKKSAPPPDGSTADANGKVGTFYPTPTSWYTNGGRTTNRMGPTAIFQNGVDRPAFLTARRTGYLNNMMHGESGIGLTPDQEEVTIPLTPEARIIGHVTLADGEGARGMQVALYRRTVESGGGQWRPAGQADVKSDGEFRIVDLEAGDYKLFSLELSDRDPVTSDPRGQQFGYPPDYYPGATDFATGALIHVAAGETFQASLTPERRRYYPVNIVGTNPQVGQVPNVEVWKNGHPGPGYALGYNFRTGVISGMLPDGEYVVRASNQGNNAVMGTTTLSVHGGPANGSVTLMAGAIVVVQVNEHFGNSEQVQARRQATDAAAQPGVSDSQRRRALAGTQVILWSTEGFTYRNSLNAQPPSDPEADGLEITDVTAGEYRVQVETQTGYVASVRSGGTDLLKGNLVVAAGATVPPIEVELRDDGGEIDGTVLDSAGRTRVPVQGANAELGFVYFAPEEGAGKLAYTSIQPKGEFQMMQLAPGTYRVVAFGHYRADLEWSNEEVMKKYKVQTVTVGAGQKEKVQVELSVE